MRLAALLGQLFVRRLIFERVDALAKCCDRCFQRREDLRAMRALFDDRIPPGLAVVIAGERREIMQRIAPDLCRFRIGRRRWLRRRSGRLIRRVVAVFSLGLGIVRLGFLGARRQPMRHRQIDETHRTALRQCPTHCLPFRREGRERKEARIARIVLGMNQQCHRRRHRRRGREADHLVGIGRPFDQHDRRIGGLQRSQQRARRARPVVADTEQMQPVGVRGRHIRSRQITSRIAP